VSANEPQKTQDINPQGEIMTENTTNQNEPSDTQKMIGDFAPKLVSLTDDVLFGEVWSRPDLSPRDRSLVTITALIAGGNFTQLPYHLNYGKENGLTETEVVEAITHLAFYTGWPKAMSAIMAAKQAFSA
jgi:4-carboxymuconolactone decarboxylase